MKKSNYLFALALGASTLTYAQVGIGTSSPTVPLDIQADDAAIDLNNSNTGDSDPVIHFQLESATTFSVGVDDTDDKLKIATGATGALETNTAVTVQSTGEVGIGTTSPSSLVEISSGTAGDAVLTLTADTDNNNETDNPGIEFSQDGGVLTSFIQLEGVAGTKSTGSLDNAFLIGSEHSGPALQFITNDNVRMTIDPGGNVGIGTTSPTVTLDVDGDAIFNESGADKDFRIEGDTDTEIFMVDASADAVGISTTTPSSGLDIQTSMGLAHTVVTAVCTLDISYNTVLASDASGDFTITLPAAASNSGRVYYIKKTNSSENEITIDGNSTETIDGATEVVLYVQYDAIRILCDGSNWHIVADERIPHTASMKRTTAQSMPHNTTTDVDFNSEVFDIGNIADITTDKITIKRAGKYLLTGSGGITVENLDRVNVNVDVEGTTEAANWLSCSFTASDATHIASASVVVNLASGDEIDMSMYQYDDSAGGAQNTHTGAGVPTLTVTEIR